jgi:magnesium chelatase family protein
MMPRVPPAALVETAEPEPSAAVSTRIAAARSVQAVRGPDLNARLAGRQLFAAAGLGPFERFRLAELADHELLSARGTERLLRVARTIADLEGARAVGVHHLEEAARYRTPARRLDELAS